MATGRSVTIDDLKKSLKSRMNQYEMLNNSLLEMFGRNSPDADKKISKLDKKGMKLKRNFVKNTALECSI